ncbi:thiamine biosynthesis protein MoeB [Peribacillus saganii]|uniref:Thiamine biosynthesis protein MoeB n=1 Tax=Peribacillus saganii TaxID=2303992 RepID=A0A372LME2_9BACI|nr:ThiF family adenylyltransferase [Peribacillus saganii]RFU67516.1 thiamine biosynthesis protein MoeB [Peribacillus saganii]
MTRRYSRQELFAPIGKEGQVKLQNAKVLIIGAGALGSASAEMLARAGIGNITIVDRDYVEWSNLQRQQLYTEEDAKKKLPKAIAAKMRLQQINSEIIINSLIADINGLNIEELIKGKSVIVDATDNFETRMVINDAAVKQNIPFIFAACVGSYGLTFPVIPGESPCLHCLLHHLPAQGMTCDTAGVISPAIQIVAGYQVTSVLKLLTGHKLTASVQSFDVWKNENAEINVSRLKKANCQTCGTEPAYPYLTFEYQTKTAVLCGRDAVQIRPGASRTLSLTDLSLSLRGLVSDLIVNPYLLSCSFENHRIVLFQDGRALIHGTNEPSKARSIYNRIIS